MITRQQFAETFAATVVDVTGYDITVNDLECTSDKKLPELGVDSLTIVSLLAELEGRLGVQFVLDDVDESTFSGVGALFDYLYAKVK